MSRPSDAAWVRYRTTEEMIRIRRKTWAKRIFFSLATGFLFGLLIPTWETFKTFSLTMLILSGMLIVGLAVRDFRLARRFRLEWTDLVRAEEGVSLQGDKPEGR